MTPPIPPTPPAWPWFVKLEEGLVSKERFDQVVPDHLAWLAELERAGHAPSSGYWGDRRGRDGAGGMLLFRAADMAAAEALVRRDPLVRAGCVRWMLHQWCVVFRSGTAAPGPSAPGGTPAPPG
ncbi:MAG: YciI family protein [Cyanobacteriota bacterium]|nr:YciI family protein [Cyanobacteriota bacterium]